MAHSYPSTPWGDIYSTPTSAIDNLSTKLYADHQQRQKQAQDEGKALDDMFSKNVSNVRDEDVNDLYNAYEKQKAAKIGLLQNNLKGADRINAEMAANKSAVDFWQVLNDSKQAKQQIADNSKKILAKPDAHYDESPTMIAQTNGVSTKDLRANGLTRPDPDKTIDPATGQMKMVKYDPFDYGSYVDKGNVNDWMPIIKKAVGTPKDANTLSEYVTFKDNNGKETVIGQKVTPIKATASPVEYFTNMAASMAGSGRAKHFNNTFGASYDDATAAHIVEQYNDKVKNDPVWEKAWGDEGMNISPDKLLNPATRNLAINSMAYALSNPPTLGTPKNVDNKEGVMGAKNDEFDRRTKKNQDFKIMFEGIRQGNRMSLASFNNKFKTQNAQEQSNTINAYLQSDIDAGKPEETGGLGGAFGIKRTVINPAPVVMKALDNPTKVVSLNNGDYEIDGKTISGDQFKTITQKALVNTKYLGNQLQANMTGKTITTNKSNSTSGSSSGHVKIKGTDKSLF